VSLILEALKKVERERATPEQRGFLVLGPAAWAPTRSNVGWVLGMIAAAAVAGGAVYLLTRPVTSAARAAPVVEAQEAAPAYERADDSATSWTPPPPAVPSRPRAAANPAVRPSPIPDRAPAGRLLRLNAISQQGGTPIAVVNERVVREGDLFDGVRILRIGAAEVEVEVDGARRTLRF
jgi:hypothetical protein